jgi:hypothetical protein
MKKSLLLSAVLNMLLPGASYHYIGKGWKKAIIEFISGIVLWVLCFILASSWNAPFLYLFVPVMFFIDGLTLAKNYNKLL